MKNIWFSKFLALALLAVASLYLVGCGGSGAGGVGGDPGSGAGSGGTPTPGVTATPTPTPTAIPVQLLSVSVSQSTVTIGGSISVTATVKNSSGQPVSGVTVTFSSSDPDKATLNPAIGTAVTDANGVASVTVEGVAAGQVNITASADISGGRQTVSTQVGVGGLESRSISFVKASSSTLTISGTGGAATSELTFEVKNQAGVPAAGVEVTFAPSVTTGGLTVAPAQATTDAQGQVKTVVTAGTVPTPVRVTGTVTVNGSTNTAQSSQLSISSGLPNQNFFSLSVETFNIDGCDFDGTKTKVNARLGDQFGNPVPDGTNVNFVTEGGRIGAASVGSCITQNGVCSVDLESQNFRSNDCRVSLLAYAVGQEAFIDSNNNGIYDNGEPFTDLADAFLKVQPSFLSAGYANNAPVFNSGFFSTNGVTEQTNFSTTANPLDNRQADRLIRFLNLGQSTPVGDGVWGQAHVRGSSEVVFSARTGELVLESTPSFAGCQSPAGASTSFQVRLVDRNGNPFAAGSTLSVEGSGVAVGKVLPAAVPNTLSHGGTIHTITLTADASRCAGGASAGASGTLTITYTPVGGIGYVETLNVPY